MDGDIFAVGDEGAVAAFDDSETVDESAALGGQLGVQLSR